MKTQESYARINKLSNVLKTTYIITIFFLLIVIYSDALQLNLIQHVLDGEQITEVQAKSNDYRQSVIGVIQTLLTIFTFILFLIWYYRAYKNLNLLYDHDNQYSNKMVIGNYFIPIISLWRPYKSTKEIWSVSKVEKKEGIEHKGQPVFDSKFNLIGTWWALFLIQNYISQFLFRTAFKDQSLQDLYYTSLTTLGSDILDIPLLALELFIVIKITDWQNKKIKKSRYTLAVNK